MISSYNIFPGPSNATEITPTESRNADKVGILAGLFVSMAVIIIIILDIQIYIYSIPIFISNIRDGLLNIKDSVIYLKQTLRNKHRGASINNTMNGILMLDGNGGGNHDDILFTPPSSSISRHPSSLQRFSIRRNSYRVTETSSIELTNYVE